MSNSLILRFKYIWNAFFGKLPKDYIFYAEDRSVDPSKYLVRNIKKPYWESKGEDYREKVIRKCSEMNYEPKSAVSFEIYLPYDLKIKDIEKAVQFSGVLNDSKFAFTYTIKNETSYYIKRMAYGNVLFEKEGMTVTVVAFTEHFEPSDINEGVLHLLMVSAMNCLNIYLNTYIVVSEDVNVEQVHEENLPSMMPVQVLTPDLRQIQSIILYTYDNRKLRNFRSLTLQEAEYFFKESIEKEEVYSLIVENTNKTLSRKYYQEGDFRNSVITVQIYIEAYLFRVFVDYLVAQGLDKEKAEKRTISMSFKNLIEEWFPSKFGKKKFQINSKDPVDVYPYQYWKYCYKLRNKCVHIGWYPTKNQAGLAYDVALNFATYVAKQVNLKSKKYNMDTSMYDEGSYVDVTEAIDFEEEFGLFNS